VIALSHDERLRHLTACGVGHRDHGGVVHVRVSEQHLLDLDSAHRPARRDDDVVGAPGVVNVTVGIHPAAILHGKPAAATPPRRPHPAPAPPAPAAAGAPAPSTTATSQPGAADPSAPGRTA